MKEWSLIELQITHHLSTVSTPKVVYTVRNDV